MHSLNISESLVKNSLQWKPVPHSIVKDVELRKRLHEEGYAVVPLVDSDTIASLLALFHQHHRFSGKAGGMFYSVYSEDTGYRKLVHAAIEAILQPVLNKILDNYKVVLNSFIVKAPGPQSEFYLHQDSTGTDEFLYSTLSIWLPLHDIDETNGAMCVIPKSHKLFSPYRGISFKAPFENAVQTARRFLQPVYLKAGEAILFDNRILHNSMQNKSSKARVVVMSASLPKNAPLMVCYKNALQPNTKIELIQQNEDYLFENTNFLKNCHLRPNYGTTIGWVEDNYPMLSDEGLLALFEQNGILPTDFFDSNTQPYCNMIGEPVSNTDSIIQVAEQAPDFSIGQQDNGKTTLIRKVVNWLTRKN